MSSDDHTQRILAYLSDECGLDTSKLAIEDDIFGRGLLDSLEAVKVLAFLKKSFGVNVRPYEVQLADIRTVGSIARLVDKLTK